MLINIYGFPVYKGKISDPEKILHYIQEYKFGESDVWNANCLVSASHGSSQLSDETFVPINDYIYHEFNNPAVKMMAELGIDMEISASECGNKQCIDCRDIWVNKYCKGHSQEIHWHVEEERDILFSFAYFAKYDKEKDAKFTFVNPMPLEITNETLRKHPSFSVDMAPDIEEGDILIFPCWMLHYVEEQETDGPRITVAGNFYEVLKD